MFDGVPPELGLIFLLPPDVGGVLPVRVDIPGEPPSGLGGFPLLVLAVLVELGTETWSELSDAGCDMVTDDAGSTWATESESVIADTAIG
jgi:hypothetical protein